MSVKTKKETDRLIDTKADRQVGGQNLEKKETERTPDRAQTHICTHTREKNGKENALGFLFQISFFRDFLFRQFLSFLFKVQIF